MYNYFMTLSIHTVYKPQENISQIYDWMTYHSAIGFKKFYMYDNAESYEIDHLGPLEIVPNFNKYGYSHQYSIEEARKMQNDIFKNFNVEYIKWNPTDNNGRILYDQVGAIFDYYNNNPDDLTAFIDIDEFIIKREEFYPSRLFQKKYHSVREYKSVAEITKHVPNLNTKNWAPKVILDTKINKIDGIRSIHMNEINLPESTNYFNHYNHNEYLHNFLLMNVESYNVNYPKTSYEEVFAEETSNDVTILLKGF